MAAGISVMVTWLFIAAVIMAAISKHGKTKIDHELFFMSLFWPVFVVVGMIASPFVGTYYLAKWMSK